MQYELLPGTPIVPAARTTGPAIKQNRKPSSSVSYFFFSFSIFNIYIFASSSYVSCSPFSTSSFSTFASFFVLFSFCFCLILYVVIYLHPLFKAAGRGQTSGRSVTVRKLDYFNIKVINDTMPKAAAVNA